MAVIVVGDIEVEEIEKLISNHFASMAVREKRPAPPMGEMSKRGFATHYHHEKEAGQTVRLDRSPQTPRRSTGQYRDAGSMISI